MTQDKGTQIIEKAKSLGASLAGIASTELVKESPSHKLHEKAIQESEEIKAYLNFLTSKMNWPEKAKSLLVIAVSHPFEKPELDWYLESGNTPGNWQLQKIIHELSAWVEESLNIKTHKVPYWIWESGRYLKDCAVLAGLGCIGKNNLLITPELGPRVRLRGMMIEDELKPTGPINFDPCDGCEENCRKVCPQDAFDDVVLSEDMTGLKNLPGRNGTFSRPKCSQRSSIDQENSGIKIKDPAEFWSELRKGPVHKMKGSYQTQKYIMFCRRCEFACQVGN